MSALTASGGFCAPGNTGVSFALEAFRITRLPAFSAVRGGIDFRPPEVKWAIQRERELRAGAQMWDWPSPPS